MISEKDIKKYLQIVRDLGRENPFYDIHAHPFEIIFDSVAYYPSSSQRGLYSTRDTPFRPPEIADLKSDSGLRPGGAKSGSWKPEYHMISLRRIYSHTGPAVFGHHMALTGIDKVLLLPVEPPDGVLDRRINAMAEIFGEDQRFSFSSSVPNRVKNHEITEFVRDEIRKFKIVAIKLHPNITGIDLGSRSGKERVESILESCEEFGLPLVVHGGRSPVLKNLEAAEYGLIRNFEEIRWGISKRAVIIAHAGGHGCEPIEMEQEVLPVLKRLLSRCSNLLVDISGLEMDSLALVLRHVDVKRILFGSDALYAAPWTALAKLAHAIKSEGTGLEETLIQIGSVNPSKFIFKGTGIKA
jgi:predicted TIM-barrel fold metal-dependent hydrolase